VPESGPIANYTSNISSAYFGGLYGYSVHLWSLCVEEQFYQIWPWLVMFAPKRFLPIGTLSIIVGSILFKAIGTYAGMSPLKTTFTLFGCLDSLALGALLAIAKHDLGHSQRVAKYMWRAAFLMGLPLFVFLQTLLAVRGPTFQFSILLIARRREACVADAGAPDFSTQTPFLQGVG
jgi:peptidoglycan/LPS O-acetylase OafA/YrhL